MSEPRFSSWLRAGIQGLFGSSDTAPMLTKDIRAGARTSFLVCGLAMWAGGLLAIGAEVPWLLKSVETGDSPALHRVAGSGSIRVRRAWTSRLAQWRPGDRWRVPTSLSGVVTITMDRVVTDGAGEAQCRGHVEGERGSRVLISIADDRLAGVILGADGSKEVIWPESGGETRVERVTDDPRVRCGVVEKDPWVEHGISRVLASAGPVGAVSGGAGHQDIDVLFCATRAAEAGAGGAAGLRALLNLSILESNEAYERSEIWMRLRLAGVAVVAYEESGDLSLDLDRLTRTADGWMDEVHGLRDDHAADVVCLVTESENSNQFAGMAQQLRSLDAAAVARGFTACLRPYLVGNYTLAHEVGHLMGGNHDRETSSEGGVLAGGYGTRFRAEGELYRTVMAYRPGVQIPHFSNPTVRFRGVPTGTNGVADNARILNHVAPFLGAVREPRLRVGLSGGDRAVAAAGGVYRLQLELSGEGFAGSVRIRTLDGGARSGTDYEPVDRRVEWAGGERVVEVSIRIMAGDGGSGRRDFVVAIREPSAGVALGSVTWRVVDIAAGESTGGDWIDTSFRARGGADQTVMALAEGKDGRIYAGGGFATYEGELRPRLARIRPDGRADAGFEAKVKYQVNAIQPLPDGRVVIGGEFNTVNDVRRNHVAILGMDGELDAGFEFETGTDVRVNAMAMEPGGALILGGGFLSVQGKPAQRVARIALTGEFDSRFDTRAGPDGEVHALVVDSGGRVVIGGRFGRVAGIARGGVARLDARGGLDLEFAGRAGANGPVRSVSVDGKGRILLGGEFTRFDGGEAMRVVRLTELGALDESFRVGAGADDAVMVAVARPDGSVWLGGRFTQVQGITRRRVARLLEDGRVDPAFDPGEGPDDWVMALLERPDGTLVIGGAFGAVAGVPRGGVAVLFQEEPAPARLWSSGREGDRGLEWEAMGLPRQEYAVERVESLGGAVWRIEGKASSPDGRLRGVLSRDGVGAGFVRLRRVVE